MRQTVRNSAPHGKAPAGNRTRRDSAVPARPGRPRPPVLAEGATADEPPPAKVGWREAISGTVTGLGYELVDVERAQRGLLRITIDRVPGRTYPTPSEFVLVDDCEQVTRQLQYVLEVEGLDYARLEVSSPGLDRPLKNEADFERFAGESVNVVLKVPFQGRKSWNGVLGRADAAEGDGDTGGQAGWQLVFKEGKAEQVFGFRFDEVREARLVPVVNFKGRTSKGAGPDGDQADVAANPADASGVDGG